MYIFFTMIFLFFFRYINHDEHLLYSDKQKGRCINILYMYISIYAYLHPRSNIGIPAFAREFPNSKTADCFVHAIR